MVEDKGKVNCQDLSVNIVEHKPVQNKLRNCEGGPGSACTQQSTLMKTKNKRY